MVDALVGFGLLVLDSWGRESQVTALIPHSLTPFLPVAYGVCFLTAVLLMRGEYESADYDFIDLAEERYLRESDEDGCYDDTYRVSVINHGNSAINAQVLLRGISPQWSEYKAKLGMPLIAKGEPATTEPVSVNPGDHKSFNLVTQSVNIYTHPEVDDFLTLWHKWPTAPRVLATYDSPEYLSYEFDLVITTAEGPVKTARYRLKRCVKSGTATRDGGDYDLIPVKVPSAWMRLAKN